MYLIGSYENLKIYPEKNIDYICEKLVPHVQELSSLQHFYLINFIIHSRTTSTHSISIIQQLIKKYASPHSLSSLSNTGIRCALLRYTSVVCCMNYLQWLIETRKSKCSCCFSGEGLFEKSRFIQLSLHLSNVIWYVQELYSIHSFIHLFIHSFTHSFIHLLTRRSTQRIYSDSID